MHTRFQWKEIIIDISPEIVDVSIRSSIRAFSSVKKIFYLSSSLFIDRPRNFFNKFSNGKSSCEYQQIIKQKEIYKYECIR